MAIPGEFRSPMSEDRLHLTLQALGRFEDRVPAEVLALARAVGGAMDFEPFGAQLERLWSRDGAGSLEVVGHGPAVRTLRRFQRELGETMRRMGFPDDCIRKDFTPHITLDYGLSRVEPRTVAGIEWQVTQFCLVDSLFRQSTHLVLDRWPLHARQLDLAAW